MKKVLLLLFLAVATIMDAQTAGYMGKRVSIGYSSYVFPRLGILKNMDEFNIRDGNKMGTTRRLNVTHCMDMDYVISSTISLCLSGQFSKMDLYKPGSAFYVQESNQGTRSSYDVIYKPEDERSMDLKTMNFSVGFKFFKSRYINPFGKYHKLEFILVRSKVGLDRDAFYYESSSPYFHVRKYELPDQNFNYKSFVVAYTIGKQRILFNKLILDYGARFGLNYNYVLSNVSVFGMLKTQLSDDEYSVSKSFKEGANFRVFESQFVNAHIGLRFLAF